MRKEEYYDKKWLQTSTVLFIAFLLSFTMNTSSMNVSAAGDFTQGVDVSGNNVTLWFKSKVDTTWVDVHYKVNSGVQQNLRMTYNAGAGRYEQFVDSAAGAVIEYFFTYNNGTPAYDTTTFTYRGAGQTDPTNPTNPTNPTGDSIYSIPASSIPNPTGGGVSLKVMNGTGGAYADDQIYWGIIGKNPANGQWSYLNLSGQLVPISTALNDAPGHLTKNGANYANIYHKVSDTSWVNLPKITSGRLFLSVGSPLYIKPLTTASPVRISTILPTPTSMSILTSPNLRWMMPGITGTQQGSISSASRFSTAWSTRREITTGP
ncbi:hypothetical protein HMSSN036_06410 [Paenibacillus macerans]|nr:hypothetical protein HMSSN036_06410 [Paenibacillus macerans]